jgi:hypothetical protein
MFADLFSLPSRDGEMSRISNSRPHALHKSKDFINSFDDLM